MPSPVVFKRWSRCPWAAFASLNRVVIIGVVKASIANAQMLKMGRRFRLELCPDPSRRFGADEADDEDSPPLGVSLFDGGFMAVALCSPASPCGADAPLRGVAVKRQFL